MLPGRANCDHGMRVGAAPSWQDTASAVPTHEVARRVPRTSSTLEPTPRGPWQSRTPRTGATSHAGLEAPGREARGRRLRWADWRVSCPGCPNIVNLLPGGPQVPVTTPAPPWKTAGRLELWPQPRCSHAAGQAQASRMETGRPPGSPTDSRG